MTPLKSKIWIIVLLANINLKILIIASLMSGGKTPRLASGEQKLSEAGTKMAFYNLELPAWSSEL